MTGGISGGITLWDVDRRRVDRQLAFGATVWGVAVSPDGKLLAVQTQADGASGSVVHVLDLASGNTLYEHEVPFGKGGLEFSPTGRALAALGRLRTLVHGPGLGRGERRPALQPEDRRSHHLDRVRA